MAGIQQGRLWAIRNPGQDVIFHIVETGKPALFPQRKQAEALKQHMDALGGPPVEVLEVEIVEKKKP